MIRELDTILNYQADILANLTTIKEIHGKGIAGRRIYNNNASQVVLTFYDAPYHSDTKSNVQYGSPAGTFLASLDQSTGSQVTLTIPAHDSMDVPSAMFGCGALKIVCAAGLQAIDVSGSS